MSVEENKELGRRIIEEVGNQRQHALIDELYAPDVVGHAPGAPDAVGLEANRQFLLGWLNAFPDVHSTIDDLIAEGDKVVIRYTWRGSQRGELQGLAPTGKPVDVPGITILRVAGGKVAESWVVFDSLGLMQQLGVIATPQQAPA